MRTFARIATYAAPMGAAGGVVTVVFFSVWGQGFGRAHLGRIQGRAQLMTVLASAVSPLLLAALTVALGMASWRVRLPAR